MKPTWNYHIRSFQWKRFSRLFCMQINFTLPCTAAMQKMQSRVSREISSAMEGKWKMCVIRTMNWLFPRRIGRIASKKSHSIASLRLVRFLFLLSEAIESRSIVKVASGFHSIDSYSTPSKSADHVVCRRLDRSQFPPHSSRFGFLSNRSSVGGCESNFATYPTSSDPILTSIHLIPIVKCQNVIMPLSARAGELGSWT